jgi:hypothetical protein
MPFLDPTRRESARANLRDALSALASDAAGDVRLDHSVSALADCPQHCPTARQIDADLAYLSQFRFRTGDLENRCAASPCRRFEIYPAPLRRP